MFGLAGCGGFSVAVVAPDSIEMYVGETRDLMPYVSGAGGGEVSFSSSDDGVVQISGSYMLAVMPGVATVSISAKGVNESLKISVKYRAASTLEIVCDGDIVQNVDDISAVTPITFSARSDEFIDPQASVTWLVDGKQVSQENDCVFTPTRFGEFEITAILQHLSRSVIVKVFRTTQAQGIFVGELEQMRNYSPVMFYAYEDIDTRNPRSVVSWTVNGVAASDGKVFEFTPTAQGRYEIALIVNGVKRLIDGNESVTVKAGGERAPAARLRFDADGVYVEWSDGGSARSVIITDPSGVRNAYSSSDITCSYRFGDGVFDATGLIDVTASSAGDYYISVSAVGQGETFRFTQYPDQAKEYIQKKLFFNNSFIDSTQRAGEFVYEMYVLGKSSAKAYISRDVGIEQVEQAVYIRAKELNLEANMAADGNVVTVELGEYVNAPTALVGQISEQSMYSLFPHIEYNETDRRSNYALAVDRNVKTAEVANTEQLLYAVMHGYKPTAVGAAKRVYDNARRSLIAIVGKSYSDYQKVHAIYDWLQWSAYKSFVGTDEAQYSSNYLEGVFDGEGRARCAVTSLGAAKAFALLASMEGIVTDIAAIERDGTYYYINKVMIDGTWYNVDVYGGDYEMSSSRELPTHERLLIDDNTARRLGIYKDDGHVAFDAGQTYYLQKYTDGGAYYDYYIADSEANDYASLKAAISGAFDRIGRGKVDIFSVTGINGYPIDKFGAEFYIDEKLDEKAVEKITANIRRAVDEYAESKYGETFRVVNVIAAGRTLHVTAIMPISSGRADASAAVYAASQAHGATIL